MKSAALFILFSIATTALAQTPDAQTGNDELRECQRQMWADPSMSPVVARVIPKTPEEAIKMRTSTAKATGKEKPAIAVWLAHTEKCNLVANRSMATWPTEAQNIIRAFQIEESKAITDLYAGTLTWGGFIEGDRSRTETVRTKSAAYDEQQRIAYQRWEAEQKRQAAAQKAFEEAQAQARYEAAAAARARDEQAQRQREHEAKMRNQQQFNEGLQLLLQANQPRPAPQIAPPIRCTSQTHWGITNTTCN